MTNHLYVLVMVVHMYFGPTMIYEIYEYYDQNWGPYLCNTDKENITKMLPHSLKYTSYLSCTTKGRA